MKKLSRVKIDGRFEFLAPENLGLGTNIIVIAHLELELQHSVSWRGDNGGHLGFQQDECIFLVLKRESYISLPKISNLGRKKHYNSQIQSRERIFFYFWRPFWILAAILDFGQNFRWPKSLFSRECFKVPESVEKTLTPKKGSFFLAQTCLYYYTSLPKGPHIFTWVVSLLTQNFFFFFDMHFLDLMYNSPRGCVTGKITDFRVKLVPRYDRLNLKAAP